ncbi:MAG: tRNA preQ1(34) S-adenosylmethionine ribosyltransferase-isomerase QueA [Woeseiaceae bacterium]|nr:tRNA preQ1(34) S-adenosylmethionine ribosyltransferase-isomerase QueA [Woeseiaceae bacterium]
MKLTDFDYYLPEDLIAKHPPKRRRDSRLLIVDCLSKDFKEASFTDLGKFLKPSDLLVFNNTKVMRARIFGNKSSGGKVEILIERIIDEFHAFAHIRANRSIKKGALISLENKCKFEVLAKDKGIYKLLSSQPLYEFLDSYGELPIPPYFNRPVEDIDNERYQTIYASELGAVAAPTAGLHFDERMFDELKEQNINSAYITLHVGAGTFQTLREEDLENNSLHSEFVKIDDKASKLINLAKKRKGRVIPIGTTSMRAIESAANNHYIQPWSGETNIFIKPGYNFEITDALLTNFHLPKSSLLLLISAMAGKELIFEAYQYAIERRFRFFSYGDAMLIFPRGMQ